MSNGGSRERNIMLVTSNKMAILPSFGKLTERVFQAFWSVQTTEYDSSDMFWGGVYLSVHHTLVLLENKKESITQR